MSITINYGVSDLTSNYGNLWQQPVFSSEMMYLAYSLLARRKPLICPNNYKSVRTLSQLIKVTFKKKKWLSFTTKYYFYGAKRRTKQLWEQQSFITLYLRWFIRGTWQHATKHILLTKLIAFMKLSFIPRKENTA